MSLTPKQQRFIEEYLIDLNATQAAIRAGYSEGTAQQIGFENLTKPLIATAVAEAQAERSKRVRVSQDDVLRELMRIGYSDAWNYEQDDHGRLSLVEGAPKDATRAVASVKHKTRTVPTKDGDPIVEHTVEYRLWDKNTALTNLGRHLGMFLDRSELTGPDGAPLVTRITFVKPDAPDG